MDRRKTMDVETFKDHTIRFMSWMNDHESTFTEREKQNFVEGFEIVLKDEPIQKHLFSFRNLILRWCLEWKKKSKEDQETQECERRMTINEFPQILQKYFDVVSDCKLQELSGVEEKAFRVIKDYIRTQIRILNGDMILQSEDLE
jgi:hypothetical protein